MHLSRLWSYPLKSGAGVPHESARLEARGLEGDRRWLVVDDSGAAITQREHAELARVSARVAADGLHLAALDVEGAPGLVVPLPTSEAERRSVHVWGQAVDAADAGEPASAWFTAALGRPARLVHMDARSERRVAPHGESPGFEVSFADTLPLLVVTRASVEELERRLVEREVPLVPLAVERFRPNLVIDGAEPFAEDRWARLAVGEVELELVKPCARCVMTTVDPRTAEIAARGEPLRTLATFRRVTDGDYPHVEGHAYFGWCAVGRGQGSLRVGDEVRVLERRAARPGTAAEPAP